MTVSCQIGRVRLTMAACAVEQQQSTAHSRQSRFMNHKSVRYRHASLRMCAVSCTTSRGAMKPTRRAPPDYHTLSTCCVAYSASGRTQTRF